MTGLEKAHQQRRTDSTAKRARVSQAIQLAAARGETPTLAGIARAAGVNRSIFYGQTGQPLRAEFDLVVTRLQAELASGVSVSGRITAATLRADLANADELNRRLRQQVKALEGQLSRLVGEPVFSSLLPQQRAAMAVADHEHEAALSNLTAQLDQLKLDNKLLEEDLDGARRANRELTRSLNSR